VKAVLGQERERERLEREKRRAEREEAMEVDGAPPVGAVVEDDMPSCGWPVTASNSPVNLLNVVQIYPSRHHLQCCHSVGIATLLV